MMSHEFQFCFIETFAKARLKRIYIHNMIYSLILESKINFKISMMRNISNDELILIKDPA